MMGNRIDNRSAGPRAHNGGTNLAGNGRRRGEVGANSALQSAPRVFTLRTTRPVARRILNDYAGLTKDNELVLDKSTTPLGHHLRHHSDGCCDDLKKSAQSYSGATENDSRHDDEAVNKDFCRKNGRAFPIDSPSESAYRPASATSIMAGLDSHDETKDLDVVSPLLPTSSESTSGEDVSPVPKTLNKKRRIASKSRQVEISSDDNGVKRSIPFTKITSNSHGAQPSARPWTQPSHPRVTLINNNNNTMHARTAGTAIFINGSRPRTNTAPMPADDHHTHHLNNHGPHPDRSRPRGSSSPLPLSANGLPARLSFFPIGANAHQLRNKNKNKQKYHKRAPAPHPDAQICMDCGKCACADCRMYKKLPSRWVANRRFLCSADEVMECCTCFCCVKTLFYHCSKDFDEDGAFADNICSCSGDNCTLRWLLIGALTLFFPCLFCYLPCRAGIACATHCYNMNSRTQCTCSNAKPIHIDRLPNTTILPTIQIRESAL